MRRREVDAMRKILAIALSALLVVGLAAIPVEAKGGGRHGGGHSGGRHHGGGWQHKGGHHHGGHHHHGGRAFIGVGFYGGWPYYGGWGWPYFGWPYYGYPAYGYAYTPPVVYTAPPAVYTTPAPAEPAIQREVVYPHGKYVLEGDGVSTPYKWVWVGNTTAPPPSETR
jgi:hypothetical protein